jgi:Calcineurin-like phosphoesterase
MRLVFTSDLHVEYHMDVVGLVAERARDLAPDVLVLAGDVCPDLRRLERSLRIIVEAAGAPVLYLAGNHELWCGGPNGSGPDSRERYLVALPRLTRRAGAMYLGVEPRVIDDVGFVGVTGWYDYSLQDPSLAHLVSPEDYEGKRARGLRCVDGHQMHWPGPDGTPLSDEDLCDTMCTLLRQQLDDAAGRCGRVVVVTHMLPSRALLTAPGAAPDRPAEERSEEARLLDAFMGSARLGALLRDRPEVVQVICGHYHHAVHSLLPGSPEEIPCEISPVGYPRELKRSLADQVAKRMRVVEV